jgi:hypothetical protein
MPGFKWDDCFATGLVDVDEQHQRLVDLINRFGLLVMRGEGASTVELEMAFSKFFQYARYHFANEEALMTATQLDGALQLAKIICTQVAALRVSAGTGTWRGSVSVGVAVRTAGMQSMEDLLKAADLGVYTAKRLGRSCFAVAD